MSIKLEPMTPADVPDLVRFLLAAYYDTKGIGGILYNAYPSPSSIEKMVALRTQDFEDPTAHHIKAVETSSPSPSTSDLSDSAPQITSSPTIACARWNIHTTPVSTSSVQTSAAARTAANVIPEVNLQALAALFDPMKAVRERLTAGKPHVYLSSLLTDPAHGRKGAGTMLLRWGLERADEAGLETFLEATPMARGLYERWGFVVVERCGFELGGWGKEGEEGTVWHYCMVRPPNAGVTVATSGTIADTSGSVPEHGANEEGDVDVGDVRLAKTQ
ncbi:acyl-CoA N-acyltransferase [Saccharata proteae CBS 121410]|uniref:Acyl-CoA N-acyltransferase n=1 Tax=Saccharata proteae CBS 121410 TaxID=1314787 RepID=A0A9P4I123_9PEZI|nr:acyl-CoA N-acyltransferase [Saccharata proteae CBS 121410]